MKAFREFLRWSGLMLLLIGASGCGLSDYQNRMDAQRKRVQDFDEFNRLLGDPIEMPMVPNQKPKDPAKDDEKEDAAAWPFDLFLRLPKGYGSTPKDKTPYYDPFPFYRYAGGSEGAIDLFVAAAWVTEPKKDDVYLKYSPVNFRIFIQRALEKYYLKTNKIDYVFQEKRKTQKREPDFKVVTPYADPDNPPKVTYSYLLYTDEENKKAPEHSAFDVYIHEQAGKQVCIVVHRPLQPANAELTKSIEACLGSLDVSKDAANKRAQAKKAKGH
jgi:hypothetical protein